MKRISKLLALILAVTMVLSMLPTLASAEDAAAEAEAPAEAQEELIEEAQEEVLLSALDGSEVEGTVSVDSGSAYASFTRTFTQDDLDAKASGKLVKVQVGSGAAAYADTLDAALVVSTMKNTGGARVITLLGDIAMTGANAYSDTNCLHISGTTADWGSKNYGDLTFDLNGYTLSYSGAANMFNTSRYGFTLKNGNIDYDGTSTRSVIACGTSSAATATSGGVLYTPEFTLENLTISANSTGGGASVFGSQVWGAKLTVDRCEIYNGQYGLLSMQGTKSSAAPTDLVFRPQMMISNSLLIAGATYPLYIVKPDSATGGMDASVSVTDSLLVTNYSGKLMVNAAFGTAGGTVATPGCAVNASDDWSGTAFDGTALSGTRAFRIAEDTAKPFSYVSSTGVTTYYDSLVDAYTNGRVNDAGQGTIKLLKDWTLADSDHNGTNHVIQSPSKSIVLDLNGYTLTNDSNRNLVYADVNNFSFTLKSTGAQGGYVQTNKAVSGTTNRSLIAIGGTGNNANYVGRSISVTVENVHAVMQKGSLCMSYLANPTYTVRSSTLETGDVAFSAQASTGWTATTTSNPTWTFENVTVRGKGTIWCNRFTRGAAVLANMSATINLAGKNVFKTNNSSYQKQNGFRLYTRYEGDSAGQYDVISMIDPMNGCVTPQESPYYNEITLNGSSPDDGEYYTVTTSVGQYVGEGECLLTVGDETYTFPTFTAAMSGAIGKTATVTLGADVEMGVNGETGCGVSTNAWNTFSADTELTVDLNGHTIQTPTDPTKDGFDRTLFMVGAGRNAHLTFTNGTLRTNGARHIIALGTTSGTAITDNTLYASGVTFERTGTSVQRDYKDGTDFIVGVYSYGNTAPDAPTMPVGVYFADCAFKASGKAVGFVTKAVAFNKQTTLGDLPTTAFFAGCGFENIEKLAHFGAMEKTLPCVMIDDETVSALRLVGADLCAEYPLNGSTYVAGRDYVLNPFRSDAETDYIPQFTVLGYAPAEEGRAYNVTIRNADSAAFRYRTKTTEEDDFSAFRSGETDAGTKNALLTIAAPVHFDAQNDERTVVTAIKDTADARCITFATIPYAAEGACGAGLNWKRDLFGELTIYGSGAMNDTALAAEGLKSVVLGAAVTKLSTAAFEGAEITDVYYCGTAQQWNALIAKTGANPFAGAELHFLTEHKHAWTESAKTPATCMETGSVTYSCSCGETKTEQLEALGHDWNDGVITVMPTAKKTGLLTRTCRRCGSAETEIIPASAVITVEGGKAKAGETAAVTLTLANNSGLAGMRLSIAYDPALTLTDVAAGNALKGLELTKPGDFSKNPVKVLWDGQDVDSTNGTILTLTFTVQAGTKVGTYPVTVSYKPNDVFNGSMENVALTVVNGSVKVESFLLGDVNGDGIVNGKDVTLMRRYLAGGYDVTIDEAIADVNGDGIANGKDVTLMRRYLAGGYDVVLGG